MADRPRLDAVLFDAGGTLVRLDFEWMAETVTTLGFESDVPRLRRAEIEGRRAYDQWRESGGAIDGESGARAYFGATLRGAGVPVALLDRVLERFFARHRERGLWTRPVEGARDVLDRLRRFELSLAVVSNSDGRAEMHLGDCGVLEGIEFVVDSHLVGVEKPERRIFATALERLRVAPEHAVFVGDIRSVDAAGAAAAGMEFVLIDPFGDYAPPDAPAIREIAELPDWLTRRFEIGARDAPNSSRPNPTRSPGATSPQSMTHVRTEGGPG